MDISNKLQTALNDIDKNFKFVKNKIETKQDAITSNDKLDYSLLSGTPTIPTKTSDLTNDSGFITDSAITGFITSSYVDNAISGKLDAPSGGTEGQVLTKTANGEEWADAQGGTIKVDDKTTSASFVVDFAGAQIQKYDVDSAVSGTFTVQYDNLDIPEGTAPTVELQVPVTGDVSNIILPSDTSVIDMPVILEGGQFNYHDIVFRAQKDFNDAVKVYANYAYGFKEELDYLSFTANESNSTVKLAKYGDGPSANIEYSTDKKNWTTYTLNDVITLQNVGDTVYFRGINPNLNNQTFESRKHVFEMTGSINGGGNVMSIIDGSGISKTVNNFALRYLFQYNEALITPPKLPATTLGAGCYTQMFIGCSNLISIPDLPALTLPNYAYQSMFSGCTSLTSPVKLNATTLNLSCCAGMFINCYNLQGVEIMTPTLANACFESMFSGCNSLQYVKVHFGEWLGNQGMNDATRYWFSNTSFEENGTFYCPSSLPIEYSENRIPEGWTVVNI